MKKFAYAAVALAAVAFTSCGGNKTEQTADTIAVEEDTIEVIADSAATPDTVVAVEEVVETVEEPAAKRETKKTTTTSKKADKPAAETKAPETKAETSAPAKGAEKAFEQPAANTTEQKTGGRKGR